MSFLRLYGPAVQDFLWLPRIRRAIVATVVVLTAWMGD